MTSFYSAFEARFRGTRDEIKARLKAYTPFLEPFLGQDPSYPCIDLGCGRGEWLELLQGLGFKARGVDLDAGMLAIAKEHGLSVTAQDALLALAELPDGSQSIVSGFHIAEHLPFEVLQQLVQEAHRVLRPGGLLILETPNPENIAVATNYFYLDPTHVRPLPPELMSFLPEYYGFCRSKIVRLQEDPSLLAQPIMTVAQIIHGVSPDYAVIAQKEAPLNVLALWDSAFARSYGLGLGVLSERFRQIQEVQAGAFHSQLQAQGAQLQAQGAAFHSQLQAQGAQLQAQSAQLQAEAAMWHQRFMDVIESRSWRITAPLRSLMERLKRIKQWMRARLLVDARQGSARYSVAAFLRPSVARVSRHVPWLHRSLARVARQLGWLSPMAGDARNTSNLLGSSAHGARGRAHQDASNAPLVDSRSLTQREREVFDEINAAILQKKGQRQ